jgi:ABC-type glycerol-3-phosphate transport system permease component
VSTVVRRPRAAMLDLAQPAVLYALLSGIAFFLLVPVFWMISTSLKPLGQEFNLPVEWIPTNPQWNNYPDAWSSPLTHADFTRYTLNSIVVTGSVTILNVLLTSMAGYGLAKYRFAGQGLLFLALLATLVLPLEVIMVPLYLTMRDLGWVNTYQGLILPVVADTFGVFLMRQWFRALPDSLIEAARIDGAGHLRTFFTIALPLAWPAMLTVAVFTFRETWDDFTWPFLIIQSDALRTIPLGVRTFQQAEQSNFPEIMAVSTLASIPLAVLYFGFQRHFVRAVTASGVKE